MRIPLGVATEHFRVLLEQADRRQEQVVEIEEALLAALLLIGAKKVCASTHQRRLVGVFARRSPRLQPRDRHQLLLHSLQRLEHRGDQVVRPLVAGQGRVADAPHQLARQDQPIRAGEDAKARRHSDRPAVLTQPAQGDRVERADGRSGSLDQVLDALAHLVGGALGERHDQDRCRRYPGGDEAAKALGDDSGLARAGPRHDANRAGGKRRRLLLFAAQPGSSRRTQPHVGVDRPMRTRSVRTLRPRSGRLSLPRMVCASSRS